MKSKCCIRFSSRIKEDRKINTGFFHPHSRQFLRTEGNDCDIDAFGREFCGSRADLRGMLATGQSTCVPQEYQQQRSAAIISQRDWFVIERYQVEIGRQIPDFYHSISFHTHTLFVYCILELKNIGFPGGEVLLPICTYIIVPGHVALLFRV